MNTLIRHLLCALLLLLGVSCSSDDDSMVLHHSEFTVDSTGGTFTLYVTSASKVTPSYPEWITLESEVSNGGQQGFTFSVKPYLSKEGRKGEISFHGKDGQIVKVIQEGIDDYVASDDLSGILNDMKVTITGGQADHQNSSSSGIEKAWDGDMSTMFNSKWSGITEEGKLALFPHKLNFFFGEETDRIDYAIYYPRTSGSGKFGLVEVQASTKEKPDVFVTVAKVDCQMKGSPSIISFSPVVMNPHTVRFVVSSGSDNIVSCPEMEFYSRNSQGFDPLTLFADELCTALKPCITLENIEACAYPFFKNIALYMYYDCYETDFRVADFKAWEHPDRAAERNKTSTYSLLDNPTGISVKSGEQLVVLAGNLYNQNISLRLVDLDKPDGDGFGDYKTYALKPGINTLTMEKKGLLYVMYHTDQYKTAPPIKIHFASGQVNGYFDLYSEKNNKAEDWNRMLANAKNGYFDALGKYAHTTFPVDKLKQITDPVEWVKFYDNMVYEEQKFMGLVKYDKMFTNRMYFHVMYTSYMYATSNRTAYTYSTMDGLCRLAELKASNWGPAHETGHVNQTRPKLRWTGMSEVTNNIHSMYIQRITSKDSRLQGKDYYPQSMTTAFAEERPHIQVGKVGDAKADVFCQLVPFWQLQLYMAYVLDKEDFYADVYEYVRTESTSTQDKSQKAWEHQVDFAYICSKVSGLDLTEFFEKWGFLRKVDVTNSDYGESGEFNIGDTELAAIRKRIKDLGFSKPKHNFWYVTEKTERIFKDNLTMGTSGNVTINRTDKSFFVSGFTNAVAFEVYNKTTGKLVYVSPGEANFTMSGDVPAQVEVRAVPASGDSKVVPVG